MTSFFLLDTNIVSHMMANPDGVVAKRAQKCANGPNNPQLCTSVVVHCELAYGVKKRGSVRLENALMAQLDSLLVLPLEEEVVVHYAAIRAHLEVLGQTIGANDTLIAAHAMALDATLVSADAEFMRVPGLKVENWLAAEITQK